MKLDANVLSQRLVKRESGRYLDSIHICQPVCSKRVRLRIRHTGIVNLKKTVFQDHVDVVRVDLDDLREDMSFKGYAANRSGLLCMSPKWESVQMFKA